MPTAGNGVRHKVVGPNTRSLSGSGDDSASVMVAIMVSSSDVGVIVIVYCCPTVPLIVVAVAETGSVVSRRPLRVHSTSYGGSPPDMNTDKGIAIPVRGAKHSACDDIPAIEGAREVAWLREARTTNTIAAIAIKSRGSFARRFDLTGSPDLVAHSLIGGCGSEEDSLTSASGGEAIRVDH